MTIAQSKNSMTPLKPHWIGQQWRWNDGYPKADYVEGLLEAAPDEDA